MSMSENVSLLGLQREIISNFEMEKKVRRDSFSQDFMSSVNPSSQSLGSSLSFFEPLTQVRKIVQVPELALKSDIPSLELVLIRQNVGKPTFQMKTLDPYTVLVGILCLRAYFSQRENVK